MEKETKQFQELIDSYYNGNIITTQKTIKRMTKAKLFRLIAFWNEQYRNWELPISFFYNTFNQ